MRLPSGARHEEVEESPSNLYFLRTFATLSVTSLWTNVCPTLSLSERDDVTNNRHSNTCAVNLGVLMSTRSYWFVVHLLHNYSSISPRGPLQGPLLHFRGSSPKWHSSWLLAEVARVFCGKKLHSEFFTCFFSSLFFFCDCFLPNARYIQA